jgi:hypothetical protein
MKADVYERITGQIVSELEKGVRPWFKPWNVEHAAGRITRPLRGNGVPYRGINVLMLWSEAMTKGFSAPIWMRPKCRVGLVPPGVKQPESQTACWRGRSLILSLIRALLGLLRGRLKRLLTGHVPGTGSACVRGTGALGEGVDAIVLRRLAANPVLHANHLLRAATPVNAVREPRLILPIRGTELCFVGWALLDLSENESLLERLRQRTQTRRYCSHKGRQRG